MSAERKLLRTQIRNALYRGLADENETSKAIKHLLDNYESVSVAWWQLENAIIKAHTKALNEQA